MYSGSTMLIATNTIYQDADHPSRIEFYTLTDDQDGDQLPDEWEMDHFGRLHYAAADDPDTDRSDNLSESFAGTAPEDPAYVFQCLESSVATFPAPGMRLSWPSATGRWYALQAATNLFSGFNQVILENLPATPPLNVVTTSLPQAESRYYRVNVRQP